MILAVLVVLFVARRNLLRLFQAVGLVIFPLVFFLAATNDLTLLQIGIFVAALVTVAQFSFWGNYLPRVYPTRLRGTGEAFAANIGGRMLGTFAAIVTTTLASYISRGEPFHPTGVRGRHRRNQRLCRSAYSRQLLAT